ncbi:MAG TPA: metalloregulator ArsR/SmtB family transcription factor [Candidatus Wallbacteria bacterium]|nr:metalloregulator ArsR/SmtB family transcription factor [Candidatus Wallbacteria bacterium]
MESISDIFKAFSEDVRLRIFGMLADGREVCVCKFSEILNSTPSKTSRHLAYLKRTKLVLARRKGQWMYYKLNPKADKTYFELFEAVKNLVRESSQLRKDLKKLEELDGLENCKEIKNCNKPKN